MMVFNLCHFWANLGQKVKIPHNFIEIVAAIHCSGRLFFNKILIHINYSKRTMVNTIQLVFVCRLCYT